MAKAAEGFLDWLRRTHPKDAIRVLGVVPDLDTELKTARRHAWNKPKAALRAYQEIAGKLTDSAPRLVPPFFEHAGRAFLSTEHKSYAAQMLAAARQAEAELGLEADDDHVDEVFLEFVAAGALPAKAMADYSRDLGGRLPADEAFRRFARLCVRRTEGGQAPSAQMAGAVRRLARATDDPATREQEYLARIVAQPEVINAPAGWWSAHRPALVKVARREPAVRAALLNLERRRYDFTLNQEQKRGMLAELLRVLEESGATAGLADPGVPDAERPADGAVGWLNRIVHDWGYGESLPGLDDLVERMAGRLRAELAGTGGAIAVTDVLAGQVGLLDLLLATGVPVADPELGCRLSLESWVLQAEDRRDLRALAADPRFAEPFRRMADGFYSETRDLPALRALVATPGGRALLTGWIRGLAQRWATSSLPDLPLAQHLLTWLPVDLLALAKEEVAAATAADLAPQLARTLRGGLLGELCWPAFEEAVAEVQLGSSWAEPDMQDAWPYLIVAGPTEVRVLGAEGCVLRHTLRIPPENEVSGRPGFHYVDGALLVFWKDWKAGNGRLVGYWHTAGATADTAPEVLALKGNPDEYERRTKAISLPLPGGGRTTGDTEALRPGDTRVPEEREVISDGDTYWFLHQYRLHSAWHRYAPDTGARGDATPPGFLAGSTVVAKYSWLRPAPADEATPLGAPVGGLLGWRVTEQPDGSLRGEDLAGRTVTMPAGRDVLSQNSGTHPFAALALPGDDRLRTLARDYLGQVHLIDPDGAVTGGRGTLAPEKTVLPPTAHWHQLRYRDPEGSVALRRIDDETAGALLTAARAEDGQLPAAVRKLIPGIGDDALVAGVVTAVRFTAERQTALNGARAGLVEEPAAPRRTDELGEPRTDPLDKLLGSALSGLYLSKYQEALGFRGVNGVQLALPQLRALHRALTESDTGSEAGPEIEADAGPGPRLHIGEPGLRRSGLRWDKLLRASAAVAYRAASTTTPPEEREALRRLLTLVDVLGLHSARTGHWRAYELHLDADVLAHVDGSDWDDSWCGMLPLDGGAFLAVLDAEVPFRERRGEYGCDFPALFHDPTGRFEVPAPYTVRSFEPLGTDRGPGWLRAFLNEWAARGQITWVASAAERFASLTGVSTALARLLVAGLPEVENGQDFPSAALRDLLPLKAADAQVAREEVWRFAPQGIPAEVVAALLPEDPARLWTDGPDVAAAAAVWNERVGRRRPVPDALLTEAVRSMPRISLGVRQEAWEPGAALHAVVEPEAAVELNRDLGWTRDRFRLVPTDPAAVGFTGGVLVRAIAMAGWLAHRLPAGDPLRAALPTALRLVRDRLAAPGMLLEMGLNLGFGAFVKAAGAPDETHEEWVRYGAVTFADLDWDAGDYVTDPILRTDLLDERGDDPHLALMYGPETWPDRPIPMKEALDLAFAPAFAALLADPGDPVAGKRGRDGTWWPQDPSRSVPDLVAEVASVYGLGEDAAAVYLTLLAMPDPTDQHMARWTGWKPARLKAARAELAATDLVVEARRPRAGRSLFLPGGWEALKSPLRPLESWKLPLFGLSQGAEPALGVIVPGEPAPDLYRRAWRRVRDGDVRR
ncbi:DNA-binding protein [Streptomyces sp. NPDC005970]|uniref:DNA-binding protein n=1 Tax=Streptomyces sp. NPDC005970 TaxID=3156723 RepID=UPI0033E53092